MDFQNEAPRPGMQMKRARKAKLRSADDGIDVDRATARRDPANYITLITSDPISKAEVKKQINAIKKKYKHLTNHQSLMLLIYSASSQASAVVQGNSGEGRYPRYRREIEVKF